MLCVAKESCVNHYMNGRITAGKKFLLTRNPLMPNLYNVPQLTFLNLTLHKERHIFIDVSFGETHETFLQ